jgi:protein TonB
MERIANPLLLLLAVTLTCLPSVSFGQEDAPVSMRRVLNKIPPAYPELARRTNVSGTVKLDALIAPDGKVKSTEVVGGNPILVQAAVEAVRKWKFEPAAQMTRERIELKFSPR